uniref:Uncharacterized protein n=1 Tax=Aegilops tauschii subsp. strangulata TaxID=200361 RepID=A0A453G2M3_AEGTS
MSIPIGKMENPLQPKIQKTSHESGAISRAVWKCQFRPCARGLRQWSPEELQQAGLGLAWASVRAVTLRGDLGEVAAQG